MDDCFDAVVKPDGTAKLSDMYNSPVCNVGRDTFKRYVLKLSEDYVIKDGVVRKL